jgi:hypothetical protein
MPLRILGLLLCVFVSCSAFGGPAGNALAVAHDDCEVDLVQERIFLRASGKPPTPAKSGVSATFDPQAEALGIAPRLSGVGNRGLLDPLPDVLSEDHPNGLSKEQLTELKAKASDLGIAAWYSKIFFVSSREAALEQEYRSLRSMDLGKPPEMQTTNLHMGGLYVIDPELAAQIAVMKHGFFDTEGKALKKPIYNPADLVAMGHKAVAQTVYQIVGDRFVALDPEIVRQRIIPEKLKPVVQFPKEGLQVRMPGWHFANPYGFFTLANAHPKRKEDKMWRLEKKANSEFYPAKKPRGIPANSRLVATFNKDIEGVMRGAMHQERKDQDLSANRIDEEMIEEFKKHSAAGISFSVEIWRETVDLATGEKSRKLIGGVFGMNVGGMINIDSIYYPTFLRKGKDGEEDKMVGDPDVARYAFLAMRDRLEGVGITFSPALMLSNWSVSLRGMFEFDGDIIDIIDNRPRTLRPNFDDEWAPDAPDDIKARPYGRPRDLLGDPRISGTGKAYAPIR